MSKMVQISDDLLLKAADLLHRYYVYRKHLASLAKAEHKAVQMNKNLKVAQEVLAVLDDIAASLDAKE